MYNLFKVEFKKLISKPTTIVGFIILAIMMIALAFLYSPTKVTTYQNENSQTSINETYNYYINVESVDLKTKLYQSNDIIAYYDKLKSRESKILECSNNIKTSFKNLSTIFNTGDKPLINENAKTVLENLQEYCNILTDFTQINYISYISNIAGNNEYINNIYFYKARETTNTIENYLNNDSENFGTQTYRLLANMDLDSLLAKCNDIALNFIYYTLNSTFDQIMDSYVKYRDHISSVSLRYYNDSVAREKLYALQADINDFDILLNQLLEYSYKIIIAKQSVLNEVNESIKTAKIILESDISGLQSHKELLNNFNQTKVIVNINNFIDNFKIISIDASSITELNNYVNLAFENYSTNNTNITKSYEQNNSINLSNNITKQKLLVDSLVGLVNNYITVTCYSQYDIYNKYLDDNQIYASKCQIELDKYYISNNIYANEINTNFQPNYQVNETITSYDYITFAMKIASILIIIYLIYIVTCSLSGEFANGNLRITLMAPYKRSSILTAKLLATITIIITMLILCLLISGITGISVFGESNSMIVTVFNSTNIMIISPITSIIIFTLCQFFEIICITSLITMISVCFKNFIGALITNSVTILAIFGLSKISLPIFSFLPTNNFNLNKYFYAFNYQKGNILNMLFNNVSYSIQDFYIGLCIAILSLIIINIISYQTFKKKSY